ncbi:hypothetical protein ACBJ59_40595 [Nonomuraea sp. MTCD27]|uniref:hypothetical protein n=1 Tax=Nonomuraea sp. MTCD27 TaxID=1676747 RepID=UPI0035BF0767
MTGTSGEEADGDALKEALRAYDEAHAALTGENSRPLLRMFRTSKRTVPVVMPVVMPVVCSRS